MNEYLDLTEENIIKCDNDVIKSDNYGKENQIINDVLNKYPLNNDLLIVAMKISIIDLTNSTHLSQYKSKISLYDLANVILNIKDFDKRVSEGDPELVNEIARNNGKVNLFSFASKYCTYHNVCIYKNDDYSIFDGIVRDTLPHYLSSITKYGIDKWRVNYDYKSFNDSIGKLLNDTGINIKGKRRKFDHFLWYPNR